MPFTFARKIRFSDTDAAGVVYFAQVLSICHEAYEASLENANINLKTFFNNESIAIPIVHGEIDFFRPLYVGDLLLIELTPKQLSENEYEITYQIVKDSSSIEQVAKAKTKHLCINPNKRSRTPLPDAIIQWLRCCL